jgi:anti-sigma factor (TIGR02949 family)
MTDLKPMNCDEALRLLAAFLDHELHFDEREGIERHLEACRSCFSRAEFERRLKGEITRLGREDVPPGFEERVRRLLGSFSTLSNAEPADGSQA